MKIYNYDVNGVYTGPSDARLDPLETKKQKKAVYLTPARATTQEPPKEQDGKVIVFNNGAWELRDILKPDEPIPDTPQEPTEEEKREILIRAEMEAILYGMALKSLIDKGVLKG